jgi:hypothetical protein
MVPCSTTKLGYGFVLVNQKICLRKEQSTPSAVHGLRSPAILVPRPKGGDEVVVADDLPDLRFCPADRTDGFLRLAVDGLCEDRICCGNIGDDLRANMPPMFGDQSA